MNAIKNVRYVFLDRDGVIARKPPEGAYIHRWEDFEFLPGAERAIASLNVSGLKVIVVTNQRGVALGLYSRDEVEALHVLLRTHLAKSGARIDAFYYCPHDKDECDCRKPKPGLFQQAFRDFRDATPQNSVMIGDSLSDIEAAVNLGMPAIFILGEPDTRKAGSEKAIALASRACGSLAEAVETYLR